MANMNTNHLLLFSDNSDKKLWHKQRMAPECCITSSCLCEGTKETKRKDSGVETRAINQSINFIKVSKTSSKPFPFLFQTERIEQAS